MAISIQHLKYKHTKISMDSKEKALLLSGGIGGPFTIAIYTPLRNAITLGAKYDANALSLYKKTLKHSLGFTGALSPTIFSCPQFVAMGPAYHLYASQLGSSLAVVPTAITESLISFGSQCRNAQLAYNITVSDLKLRVQLLQKPYNPIHAGLLPHVLRNAVAMSGIRIFNEPCTSAINSFLKGYDNEHIKSFLGDFSASILAAGLSMPFNQCFNYLAVTPAASARDIAKFLDSQYFYQGRISPRLLRDLGMRIAYNAPQLTTFVVIERMAIDFFATTR